MILIFAPEFRKQSWYRGQLRYYYYVIMRRCLKTLRMKVHVMKMIANSIQVSTKKSSALSKIHARAPFQRFSDDQVQTYKVEC